MAGAICDHCHQYDGEHLPTCFIATRIAAQRGVALPPITVPEDKTRPSHYGGADNPYEAIKVIEAWGLGFCLGNAVKYISRAGKKEGESELDDLKKARWYIDRHIEQLQKSAAHNDKEVAPQEPAE